MKWNNILLFVLLISSTILNAQNRAYETLINWEEKPTCSEKIESEDPTSYLAYHIIEEQVFLDKYAGNLLEFYTIYKKVKINTEEGVEEFNKIYVPLSGVVETVEIKARVITPEGKIIDLKEENIQESDGGDGLAPHKYFALDGVTIGSDVEYTYTQIKGIKTKGRKFTLQSGQLRRNVKYDFICPSFLEYAFKSYNGCPEFEIEEDKDNETTSYSVSVDEIPKMESEDYAAFDANLMCFVYKLEGNKSTGKYGLVGFSEIAQIIYKATHFELKKKELKSIKKIIKLAELDGITDEEQKIRKLEAYIKDNIVVEDAASYTSIADAVKNRYTSDMGMQIIFTQAVSYLGIQHEVVMGCDRKEDIFDAEFEHHSVLNELFLYFPKLDLYLDPTNYMFRLGFIPSNYTHTDALFIKEVGIGALKAGSGKVKFLKAVDASENVDEMIVDVNLEDMTKPIIKFKRSLTGYSANIQTIYPFLDPDQKKEIDEDYCKFSDDKGELLNYTVTGVSKEDIVVNPLVYEGELEAVSILEKAGDKYLFNVGTLIGPQMEMYQEKERQNNIDHSSNKTYKRVITFTIPDGYTISGLEAININENYPADNPQIYFRSSYTQEGNKITITCEEVYNQMTFDKSEYESFRTVINAAANFNKVAFFLVKA